MKIEYSPNNKHILTISAENEEDKIKLKEYCKQLVQELKELNESC